MNTQFMITDFILPHLKLSMDEDMRFSNIAVTVEKAGWGYLEITVSSDNRFDSMGIQASIPCRGSHPDHGLFRPAYGTILFFEEDL